MQRHKLGQDEEDHEIKIRNDRRGRCIHECCRLLTEGAAAVESRQLTAAHRHGLSNQLTDKSHSANGFCAPFLLPYTLTYNVIRYRYHCEKYENVTYVCVFLCFFRCVPSWGACRSSVSGITNELTSSAGFLFGSLLLSSHSGDWLLALPIAS